MSKVKIIPDLRFPEFEKDGEWNSTPLADLCELITKGTTPTTLGYNYTESGINFIKIESILEGKINLDKAAFISIECNEALKRSQLKEDDILFSIAGALGVVTTVTKEILPANTNQALSIVRLKNKKQKDYVKAFLKSNLITSEVQKIKAGAAQPNISLNQVANFSILIPKNTKEQQKIASCLSSLDEIIATHSQKLNLLKDHKKGMMQNLFPQDGENVPKYRFKEFENDGEWVKTKLGDSAIFINGRAYKQEDLLETGKYRVLRVGNFFTNNNWYYSDLELEENKYCEDGDLLYAWSASFGPRVWRGEKVIYHYHIWKVLPSESISNDFLFVLLDNETERMKTQNANGFALLHITKSTIENWECKIPKSKIEQQKIASCLSSLDALITAQTERIEQLKLHKKGLMQGLFPKIEI
jgi:type I restriction enzyme S subunit